MGIFDNFFDLNGDGKVTPDEEFMEFMMFNEIMNEEKKKENDVFYSDMVGLDEDEDDLDEDF